MGGSLGTLEFESFPTLAQPEHLDLAERDQLLIAELRARVEAQEVGYSDSVGATYLNAEIAELVRPTYSTRRLRELEITLDEMGTFDIPTFYGKLDIDGVEKDIPFIAAVSIDGSNENISMGATGDKARHIDMIDNIYERDNYQFTDCLMSLYLSDPIRYAKEGVLARHFLEGQLHRMSAPAQLKRFDNVIERGRDAGQLDWPNITLRRDDLGAEKPFEWRHKQDSVQMLANLTLKALEVGFMKPGDLTARHQQFLGRVAPMLERAGYPHYASSGSWEEVAAISRTSVLSVESRMFKRLNQLMQSDLAPELSFLAEDYQWHTGQPRADFTATTERLLLEGLTVIGQQIPFESPNKDQPETCYREADAALTYLHMYDIPALLVTYDIPIARAGRPLSEREIEKMIDAELDTLYDPHTGALKRYIGDSYQRENWHTDTTQEKVGMLKRRLKADAGDKEIDLNQKQLERNEIVPKGREAVWPHPMFQRAAASAQRSLDETRRGNHRAARLYRKQSTQCLNEGLRSVTGSGQYHAAMQRNGRYALAETTRGKIPESLNTYTDDHGSFIVASPHFLNWAAITCREAIGLLSVATEQARDHRLGRLGLGRFMEPLRAA